MKYKAAGILVFAAVFALAVVGLKVVGVRAATPLTTGMANPASVYCVNHGGTDRIVTNKDGSQSGVCVFSSGAQCDEWSYYNTSVCATPSIPVITVTTTLPAGYSCNNFWWFNASSTGCSESQFCGQYLYQGLRTFPTQAACQAAFPGSVSGTTTLSLGVGSTTVVVPTATTTPVISAGTVSVQALQAQLTQLISLLLELLQQAAAKGLLSASQLNAVLGSISH